MKKEEILKLIPDKSFIRFAGSNYMVAEIRDNFGALMIGIYDEPPSLHIDYLNGGSVEHPIKIKQKTPLKIFIVFEKSFTISTPIIDSLWLNKDDALAYMVDKMLKTKIMYFMEEFQTKDSKRHLVANV